MNSSSRNYIVIDGGEKIIKDYYYAKEVLKKIDDSINLKFLKSICPGSYDSDLDLKDYFPNKSEEDLRDIRSLIQKKINKFDEDFVIIDGNLCPR